MLTNLHKIAARTGFITSKSVIKNKFEFRVGKSRNVNRIFMHGLEIAPSTQLIFK